MQERRHLSEPCRVDGISDSGPRGTNFPGLDPERGCRGALVESDPTPVASGQQVATPPGDITQLLWKVGEGNTAAEAELAILVYKELHGIAERLMRSERVDQIRNARVSEGPWRAAAGAGSGTASAARGGGRARPTRRSTCSMACAVTVTGTVSVASSGCAR